MVFQHYALFPHLTVGDNVAFGPKRKGMAKDEVRRRVGDALALVRLEGYEKRKPHQLSGGQQQRVALARALANRPDVLLLDEPLGALDLKLRRQLQVELKRIQSEVGITFVYVTHDQEEALTMSDRIAVMNAGHVEQLGTPEELYERPATRFVADFIGTTNLLRATVDDATAAPASTPARRSPWTATARPSGSALEISIRPESIRLVAAGSADAVPAVVEQAAYLGNTVSYLVRTSGGTGLTILTPKAGARLPVDSEIAVAWDAADALVLGVGPPQRPHGGDPHDPVPRRLLDRPRARADALPRRAPDDPPLPAGPDRDPRCRGRAGSRHRRLHLVELRDAGCERLAGWRRERAAPSNAPSAAASAAASASAGPTPEPTPVPSPEGELFIYNWADYMGKNVVPGFEKKYKIKVTYDFFDNYDTMLAKIGQGGSGYDITFPTGTDIPGLLERGLVQPIDHSLLPNIKNLGAEWQNPGYDAGNAHSIPYMWWTTGVAYDTAKVPRS